MVANEETFDENSSLESNYKEQYKEMKRKLRLLIYVSDDWWTRLSKSVLVWLIIWHPVPPNGFQLAPDIYFKT